MTEEKRQEMENLIEFFKNQSKLSEEDLKKAIEDIKKVYESE